MGYFISYDRKFIRTHRGIVPMVLGGSNNVYNVVFDSRNRRREVRQRTWFLMRDDLLELPEDKFMERVNELYVPEDKELWKSNGAWLDGTQARRWFARGVKDAAWLEDILAVNPRVGFTARLRSRGLLLHKYIHTSDELEDWIDEARAEASKYPQGECWYDMGFDVDHPLKAAKPVPRTGSVVLRNGRKMYVSSYDKAMNCVYCTADPSKAKQFGSVMEACKELGDNIGRLQLSFVPVTPKLLAPRQFALVITEGTYKGQYVLKTTARKIIITWNASAAQRFLTESEAKRKAAACAGRFSAVEPIFLG